MIKCGIEDPVKTDGAPDSVLRQEMSLFDKPTRGTSMDEFKEMLHSFLKVVFFFPHPLSSIIYKTTEIIESKK